MEPNDEEIIHGVLSGNEKVISYFFGEKVCGKVFTEIMSCFFHNQLEIEENEFIDEFYLYLQEDDWHKLRQFEYNSKLTTYIWEIACHFLAKMVKKEQKHRFAEMLIAEDVNNDRLQEEILSELASKLEEEKENEKEEKESTEELWNREENELCKLKNKRYRFVLQELLTGRKPQEIADELDIGIDNLYNIKWKALKKLDKIRKKEADDAKKIVKKNKIKPHSTVL